MKRILRMLLALIVAGWLVVSILVQREAAYTLEQVGGTGPERALVLYHPSRDAHFSDDLSTAIAAGLAEAGYQVERATTTSDTPDRPEGFSVIVVVANTYYWTPDRPTLRYLKRARFEGARAIGLIGGAGATGRSERLLAEALRRTGATEVATHSFWLWRPNDESRMEEPNRSVALDQARRIGKEAAPGRSPNPGV